MGAAGGGRPPGAPPRAAHCLRGQVDIPCTPRRTTWRKQPTTVVATRKPRPAIRPARRAREERQRRSRPNRRRRRPTSRRPRPRRSPRRTRPLSRRPRPQPCARRGRLDPRPLVAKAAGSPASTPSTRRPATWFRLIARSSTPSPTVRARPPPGGAGQAPGVDQVTRPQGRILFEGRDAAGKGGAIKRISETLNPRVCRICALGIPDRA